MSVPGAKGGGRSLKEGFLKLPLQLAEIYGILVCDTTAAGRFFGNEKTAGRFYEQLDKFHEDKFEQCLAMTGKMRYNQL